MHPFYRRGVGENAVSSAVNVRERVIELRDRFEPGLQPALVARRGVLLDHADFGRAIDQRKGLGQHFGGNFGVFAGECAPHSANLVTEAGLVLTVDFSAPFGLTHTLQRGIGIGHL